PEWVPAPARRLVREVPLRPPPDPWTPKDPRTASRERRAAPVHPRAERSPRQQAQDGPEAQEPAVVRGSRARVPHAAWGSVRSEGASRVPPGPLATAVQERSDTTLRENHTPGEPVLAARAPQTAPAFHTVAAMEPRTRYRLPLERAAVQQPPPAHGPSAPSIRETTTSIPPVYPRFRWGRREC